MWVSRKMYPLVIIHAPAGRMSKICKDKAERSPVTKQDEKGGLVALVKFT